MTTLLIASGGGHLRQLTDLAPRLRGVDQKFLWVTWRSEQSESLLAGRDVVFVRPTRPRDAVSVSKNLDAAVKLVSRRDVTGIVTTGSQIVLPFLLIGRALRKPCHFIESAARSAGPSLSAKLSSYLPGMCLYSQYHTWADHRWRYVGSVLDGFAAVPQRMETGRQTPLRVVVMLGTLPNWEFIRLIEACLRVIPAGSDVLWQTGCTDVSGLGIDGREAVPAHELEAATAAADVVISHAGVGSALTTLRCGKRPILVPRDAGLGEHVDDHQRQIAIELASRDLALFRTPESLRTQDLEEAPRLRVQIAESLPPIHLTTRTRQATRRVGRRS